MTAQYTCEMTLRDKIVVVALPWEGHRRLEDHRFLRQPTQNRVRSRRCIQR